MSFLNPWNVSGPLHGLLLFCRHRWVLHRQSLRERYMHQRDREFRMQLQWRLWAGAHDELWRQVLLPWGLSVLFLWEYGISFWKLSPPLFTVLFCCPYSSRVEFPLPRPSREIFYILSSWQSPWVAQGWPSSLSLSLGFSDVFYIFMASQNTGSFFIYTLGIGKNTSWTRLHYVHASSVFYAELTCVDTIAACSGLWRLRFQFHSWNLQASFFGFCPTHTQYSQQPGLCTWKGRKYTISLSWCSFPELHSLQSTMVTSRLCPLDRILGHLDLAIRLPPAGYWSSAG